MKVGDAIEIITHYVSKVQSLTFEDFLEIARIYFEKLGFVCVPFILREENGKVKKKPLGNWGKLRKEGIAWEEIEKRYWKEAISRVRVKKRENEEGEIETFKEKTEDIKLKSLITGIGALTGSVSAMTVIDIDDTERFERTFEVKLDELISTTLAQRTPRGGVHLFYKYDPEIKTGVFKEFGLDVRNDDALIVLYPSYVLDSPEKRYEFINEKVSEIASVPEKLKKLLLKKRASKEKEIENEGKKSVKLLSFRKAKKEDFLKIAKTLGELYREDKISGHEDIDFALVGGLVEIGLDEKEIHEILKEIYQDEYDEALSEYVIERAKERIEKGEKYISLGTLIYKLKQLSDDRAKEILEVLSPKSQSVAPSFVAKGGVLFKVSKDFTPVGPHISLKEKLVAEGETYYLAEFQGKEFILPMGKRERILEVVENETGISVSNLQAFKEYLIYEQSTKELLEKRLITKMGWDKDIFRIPTIERESEVWEIPHLEKFTTKGDREDHYYIINKVLSSSSDLSILLLASLSCPLLYIIDTQPFLVHVSGRPASGKTTACAFAVSLFYNGKDYFTLHSTQNAIEILLSTFRDIPILFDEEELSKDPQFLISLAYMLFSSKGKSRATRSLKVKQNEIRSVVFTTSEHSIEDTLSYLEGKGVVSKLGALRRVLHVEVSKDFWKGLDFKEIENSLKEVWGYFGRDWILFLERNKEKVKEVYEKVRKRETVSGCEHIFHALWTAKELLEEFLSVKLSSEVIERFEERQEEILRKNADIFEKIRRTLPSFIVSNQHRMFPFRYARDVIGEIDDESVYLLERGLKEYVSSFGLSYGQVLNVLEEEEILSRERKVMKGIEAEVLRIDLKKLKGKRKREVEFKEGFTFKEDEVDMPLEEIRVRCQESGLDLVKEGENYRIVKPEEEIGF